MSSTSMRDGGRELRSSAALGLAILVQTASALIWAGAASERLTQLEHRAASNPEMLQRVARLEEQTVYMRAQLDRIEAKLDDKRAR